jgi:hypothetical protein
MRDLALHWWPRARYFPARILLAERWPLALLLLADPPEGLVVTELERVNFSQKRATLALLRGHAAPKYPA